ncbi:MAG TPA: hypothetical protein VI876_12160 [Dehalococcoidia bacterium]|nr:hypothetical protein [Dehalococcoidia bacterium]
MTRYIHEVIKRDDGKQLYLGVAEEPFPGYTRGADWYDPDAGTLKILEIKKTFAIQDEEPVEKTTLLVGPEFVRPPSTPLKPRPVIRTGL